MKKGQTLDSGFSVIDIVDLAEMRATGIWAKHQKAGVEVFHVLNDDIENLFAFAFATAPEDNTGAAHILEHTVLCGSEHYPLKDALMVLAQGSLQTFLNAWTFSDKTVYPASSVNEHDYFNLMSVYGDAVFRPLLSEWAFMQEGHRYEFVNTDSQTSANTDKLSITGVVYNEMKGVYSSPDTYAGLWSVKAVMPDTPYAFESGGDPEYIPEISREDLKYFHKSRYSPANCRIFLAGNIPTEKQLAFLNERFFSSAQKGSASPPVAKQKRWTSPKEFRVPCPAGEDTKLTVFLSWLCSGFADTDENIALVALTEILLGHDGSPLTRTLVESGLGEDITPVSGFEGELHETLFTVGLRGVDKNKTTSKEIESLIFGELRRLACEGIPKEEIEAALLFMEFSQREIRRSGGPFSLVWMRRALKAWLHGGKPWDSLLFAPAIEKLKRRIANNGRFFEGLIEKYLLDNPHRALVVMEPQEDFLPKQEEMFARKLAKIEEGLSGEEKKRITEKSAILEKFQSEKDSPEALASIPHLSRNDLDTEPEVTPRRLEDLRGIPALCHELYTNGITYAGLSFPLDVFPPEDYPWLPFFARAVVSVGLPGADYAEVSSLLAQTTGGFNALLHTGSAYSQNTNKDTAGNGIITTPSGKLDLAGRDWLIYRLKCLDEKTSPSLDLVLRLICEADFTDERRLRDLVLEMKNGFRSGFAPCGHIFASHRANRLMSPSRQVEEIWNGLTQVEFTHRLAETDTADIAAKLKYLRNKIAEGGVIVNVAGSSDAIKSAGVLIGERFGRFGPPHLRNPVAEKTVKADNPAAGVCEVFASPSLQVGFAAVTLRAAAYDTPEQVAETVLAHKLSTDTLMEEIRMKGGAYGAFAANDGIERCFTLSTYRDPDPLRSLDTFTSVLKNASTNSKDLSNDDVEKMIIGCYSRETRPRSPSEKSFVDLLRLFSRIDDGCRRRKLERLITVSATEISSAGEELASQSPAGKVIIAGTRYAEKAAKTLGVKVQTLPV